MWYEWCVEGYYLLKDIVSDVMEDGNVDQSTRKIKYGMTEIHNIGGKGSNMVIT